MHTLSVVVRGAGPRLTPGGGAWALPRLGCFCDVTVSQERGFGSNHLVFLRACPQHAMGRWESRILGYTRYNTRDW